MKYYWKVGNLGRKPIMKELLIGGEKKSSLRKGKWWKKKNERKRIQKKKKEKWVIDRKMSNLRKK